MTAYETVNSPQADLQVVIDPPGPAPNPALTGQPYGYAVTVTNNGPQTATDVRGVGDRRLGRDARRDP